MSESSGNVGNVGGRRHGLSLGEMNRAATAELGRQGRESEMGMNIELEAQPEGPQFDGTRDGSASASASVRRSDSGFASRSARGNAAESAPGTKPWDAIDLPDVGGLLRR